jgi:glycosylphosphatidylinositol transamidase (GPIT) subunit GPI8
MKRLIFLLNILSLAFLIDADLYAIIFSSSTKFENFRHSINPLLIYNFLKKNNIPDENVKTFSYYRSYWGFLNSMHVHLVTTSQENCY